MILCLISARFMLELLGTKDDLIEGAVLYFRIYAIGMPALGIFNFGNGVLSANGDTKRPLTYLLIAGILNVIFNLFFVIVCGMAEDGVALASIITQYVSAILILLHMGRQEDNCTFRLRAVSYTHLVSDWWHNFRFLPGRMLAVTDADGNRYRITNVDTLDKASYKRLLMFI